MVLADSLLTIVRKHRLDSSPFKDIGVITGKGLGSGLDGPVLVTGVPQFLSDFSGPRTTRVKGNEGRFLITKESLSNWVESPEYNRFKARMTK